MPQLIGRLACPWCGFDAAHVKQSEGKRPYHHCPECGLMTHAKSGDQARLLTRLMRPEGERPAAPVPPSVGPQIVVKMPASPAPATAAAAPAAPASRTSWADAVLKGLK